MSDTPPPPPAPEPPSAGVPASPPPPQASPEAAKVQDQVQRRAGLGGAPQGGGTLWSEPILVVNQQAKLIELVAQFKVFDQHGNQIGAVEQVGQSTLKKALRFVTSVDQFLTHTYEIRDAAGNAQLVLKRPAKLVKSKFQIMRGDGSLVGEVKQDNVFGKIHFSLEAGGQKVGSINAENWRAWNFSITDASGAEVARITKTWEGLAKTMFTTADNFVVQIHRPPGEPLHSLLIAAALCVDTALKQDNRGFN